MTKIALKSIQKSKSLQVKHILNGEENPRNYGENQPYELKYLMCVIGSKKDLENKRVISQNEAMAFAGSLGLVYFDTSARTGRNCLELADCLARRKLEINNKLRSGKKTLIKTKVGKLKQDNKLQNNLKQIIMFAVENYFLKLECKQF